ncbi:MAG: ATP-binding protein [Gammaproteobacteria bacterium]|nr:ATP-binding protein [Gammaproteobacteria bacterium]MYE83664.1 ATP-binding protein [Gammaproteobacteria bacterium]
MSANLSLKVATNVEDLRRAQDEIEAFCNAQAWPADVVFQIGLVVEELGINVVNYAYEDGAEHEFSISVTSDDGSLTLEIVDGGQAFDPLEDAPEPDLDASLEDRPIGGLGVYLVRTIMDELSYRREDGHNRLTAIKRRPE